MLYTYACNTLISWPLKIFIHHTVANTTMVLKQYAKTKRIQWKSNVSSIVTTVCYTAWVVVGRTVVKNGNVKQCLDV